MAEVIHYSSPLGMLTVAAEENQITVLVIDGQKYMERHLKGETTEREAPILKQAEQWEREEEERLEEEKIKSEEELIDYLLRT